MCVCVIVEQPYPPPTHKSKKSPLCIIPLFDVFFYLYYNPFVFNFVSFSFSF